MEEEMQSKTNWGVVIIVVIVAIIAVLIVRNGSTSSCETDKADAVDDAKSALQSRIDDMQKQISKLQAETTTESDEVTSQSVVSTSNKAIGYISNVKNENGSRTLEIDYIQWLTGDEALKAMKEDNKCEGVEDSCLVDNDYYIRNQNDILRTFKIAEDVKILMQTYKIEERGSLTWDESISFDDFMAIFNSDKDNSQKHAPYHIVINNNTVTKITEQYIP